MLCCFKKKKKFQNVLQSESYITKLPSVRWMAYKQSLWLCLLVLQGRELVK